MALALLVWLVAGLVWLWLSCYGCVSVVVLVFLFVVGIVVLTGLSLLQYDSIQ